MNIALRLLKWPVVVWLALFAWAIVLELPKVCTPVLASPTRAGGVAVGLVIYGIVWWGWMHKSSTAAVLATLEHEFAHMLACVLTLCPVQSIEARASREGSVLIAGQGNWVVAAAPYVAPISLMLPATVLATAAGRHLWAWVYFGFSLGFHVQTTWRETHSQQSDLKELGSSAWILLPACHVLVVAWICGLLAGNQTHFTKAFRYSNQVVRTTLDPSTHQRAWDAVASVWNAQLQGQR